MNLCVLLIVFRFYLISKIGQNFVFDEESLFVFVCNVILICSAK